MGPHADAGKNDASKNSENQTVPPKRNDPPNSDAPDRRDDGAKGPKSSDTSRGSSTTAPGKA